MTDGPDLEINNQSSTSHPKSDVEIRKQTRELRRMQRRAARSSGAAQPWYTVLLSVLLLVAAWFVVGTFLGLEARRVVNANELAAINATQTQQADITATPQATLPQADATATFAAVAELATATAEARATDTPTPTPTPTSTPQPTQVGGSRGEVAYISEEGGTPDIVLLNLDTGERRPLTDTAASENDPRFSPDGSTLAFTSNAGGNGRHIFILDLTDEEADPLQLTSGLQINTDPVWAPDGQSIAYRSVEGSRFFINEVTLDGEVSTIIQLPSLEQLYDWSPDGEILTFYGRTQQSVFEVMAYPVGDGSSQARYPLTDALGDIQFVDYGPERELAVFTATAFEPVRRIQVYLADATCPIINTGDCIIRRVTEDNFNYRTPRFSPDGTLLLTAANVDANFDLFLLDLEGNIVEQLTDTLSDDYEGVWRPAP